MELLLNLVWVVLACASLTTWMVWRNRSDSRSIPGLLRGTLVIVCILALLFPVISMSDDMSQAAVLAEGNRLQDVLKSPIARQFVAVVLLYTIAALGVPVFRVAREALALDRSTVSAFDSFSAPLVSKRPPPALL